MIGNGVLSAAGDDIGAVPVCDRSGHLRGMTTDRDLVVKVMAEGRDLQKAVGSGDGAWFAAMDGRGRGQWRDADGRLSDPDRAGSFHPTVYLYDNHPGGMGLSEPLFRRAPQLVADAFSLICECECSGGCPACVGPVLATDESRARSMKALAMTVLEQWA